jgi:AraC-like DNA-binding protein
LNENSTAGYSQQLAKDWFLFKNLSASKSSTKKEILRRVLTGKDFMDHHFLQNPEIKQVALESSMSEFHFYRCFKQVTGSTPYQYMLEKRLAYSRELLAEKRLLVSQIATQCGFPDVFTFSKAFKRKYGVSPTKFEERGS